MNRLQEKYQKEIIPVLEKEFGRTNAMSIAKIKKVVLNVGLSEQTSQEKAIDNVAEQLKLITGQKPKVTPAKKSISGFKINGRALRQGDPVGVMVTLRGQYMWEFLDKLISIVLPRVKDFQGVAKSFDNSGNYNLGISEQIVFPEIVYDKIDKVRGLQVTVVIQNNDPKESVRLLELLGMPFKKDTK